MGPMNSTQALKILSRRMAKAPEHEREAFNYLVDYVAENQKRTLIDNQLFGKLYIYILGRFIQYYQCTAFDPTPQKELHRLLKAPVRDFVTDMVAILNDGENYVDASGKTAKWEYEEVAQNLRAMINKAIETYSKK